MPVYATFLYYCRIEYGSYNGVPMITDAEVALAFGQLLFFIAVFYILQRRELKRFVQQQDLVNKEREAIRKE